MMALGFKPGDEIILPVFTYVATAEVVALLGLKPVFVDVDENTFNIDVGQVERKITARTVAVLAGPLFFLNARMVTFLFPAQKIQLPILEKFSPAGCAKPTSH